MTVAPTSAVTSAAAQTSTAASTTSTTQSLSYNDFLTLLMAEMKNQDPTQPMDPSTMVSQLATVSEVGQAVQTNTTLSSLLTASSLSQVEGLVGATITSSDGSTSGTVASVSVTSSGATATLTSGQTVSRQRGDCAMNEGDAVDLVQQAMWMVVVGAGPAVGAAMAVGVAIALLQALTQVQEMTLTFVPKMIAVFLAASLTASFVGGKFAIFRPALRADRAGLQVTAPFWQGRRVFKGFGVGIGHNCAFRPAPSMAEAIVRERRRDPKRQGRAAQADRAPNPNPGQLQTRSSHCHFQCFQGPTLRHRPYSIVTLCRAWPRPHREPPEDSRRYSYNQEYDNLTFRLLQRFPDRAPRRSKAVADPASARSASAPYNPRLQLLFPCARPITARPLARTGGHSVKPAPRTRP